MITHLSPIIDKLFKEYKDQHQAEDNLSEIELFLYSFCRDYQLAGEIHTVNNKFYFVVKHPTFTMESKILKQTYKQAAEDCIYYCDVMLQALIDTKEKHE
jgi:hypothetical protein